MFWQAVIALYCGLCSAGAQEANMRAKQVTKHSAMSGIRAPPRAIWDRDFIDGIMLLSASQNTTTKIVCSA
jgi:hypothetical protein